MPDLENVPVSIRLSPDGGTYQVGVEIYGAFQPFTFGGWPKGSFDAYVSEAKAAQDAAAASAPPASE